MDGKWLQSSVARRLFLTRLGAGVGVVGAAAAGSPVAMAQAADTSWRPARHAIDEWYDKIPGVHRFVFDTSTAEGMGLAMQFASNYYNANEQGYGLKESDIAVVIVARHKSTSFAYNDAIWAKYGKFLSEQAEFTDPKTKQPPAVNLFLAEESSLPPMQSGKMNALIKKGANFAVCSMSTRGISGRIAKATGVETDAVVKEITSNLVGNAHMVAAGILAVNRAQEHGYSFIYAA
jgi:intracellular sulfur oxidation DsrE/DsrF family protein